MKQKRETGIRPAPVVRVHCPHACTAPSPPPLRHLQPDGTFVVSDEPSLTHHHPSPQFTPGFTLDIVHSKGLGKFMMTRIYHYSITENSFAALRILRALEELKEFDKRVLWG